LKYYEKSKKECIHKYIHTDTVLWNCQVKNLKTKKKYFLDDNIIIELNKQKCLLIAIVTIIIAIKLLLTHKSQLIIVLYNSINI